MSAHISSERVSQSQKAKHQKKFLDTKIGIVGSGNWGTAIAYVVGRNLDLWNAAANGNSSNEKVNSQISMWVYEEMINGEKLSEIINTRHENVRYLPGIQLSNHVVACPDLLETVKDASILLFVVPHQFLPNVLKQLKGQISEDTVCVSLIKGVDSSDCQLRRFSQVIQEELGVKHVAVVMGANVANDIASNSFAETTVACADLQVAEYVATLFDHPLFRTQISSDVSTVELCGALKNIFALGAGFCDGLGLGCSTKAAVIRQAMEEMAVFCKLFGHYGQSDTEPKSFHPTTMLLSCGIADLIATCYGGRNRKCAEEFARRLSSKQPELETLEVTQAVKDDNHHAPLYNHSDIHLHAQSPPHSHDHVNNRADFVCRMWEDIEGELLNGQKLQGVSTCEEVMHFLMASHHFDTHPSHFPLLRSIYAIACQGEKMEYLFEWDFHSDK